MAQVCVDASLVLLWLLPERRSDRAHALRNEWQGIGTILVAPPLLMIEVASVLREGVYHRRITPEEGENAFQALIHLGIQVVQTHQLLERVWEIGKALNTPKLYDMHYVALADREMCPLWTADRRLVNLVQPQFADVYLVE